MERSGDLWWHVAGLGLLALLLTRQERRSGSPSHGRVVCESRRAGTADVWVMHVDGTQPTTLTHHPAGNTDPTPSPDGKKIALSADQNSNQDVGVMDADGRTPVHLTQGASSQDWEATW